MKNETKTSLRELYSAFFRVGALTFGGGYAMLPMLERECVIKHKWVDEETLADYFAIGQCTPGVIAVNTATFIGSSERGLAGAAVATLGVVSPSIVIIIVIAALLKNFASIPAVIYAFDGIRVAVCVLMVNAVVKLVKKNVTNTLGIVLAVTALVLTAVFDMSPVFPILGAALVGIGEGLIRRRSK